MSPGAWRVTQTRNKSHVFRTTYFHFGFNPLHISSSWNTREKTERILNQNKSLAGKKKEKTQELVHLICQILTQNWILQRSTFVAAFRATALKEVFFHGSLFLFGKAYFSNEQLDEALQIFKPFLDQLLLNYSLQDRKSGIHLAWGTSLPVQDFLLDEMIGIHKIWEGNSVLCLLI